MPNVAAVLKGEITRLSSKAVRHHIAPIRSATNTHRSQIAELKRQLHALQRQVALLQRLAEKALPREPEAAGKQIRFTAKGLRSLRSRLDLSAEEFGQLVEATGKTVYSWEGGASPRAKYLPAIAALRKIGKREARKRLEELNAA